MEKGESHFIHCHTGCHCLNPHHIASLDTAFDLSWEVGETTAQVEQAAIETFIARERNPCLGGYPWLENNEQPKGTVAVYPKKIGYVEYIDMVKLSKLLTNDPRHVYLVAQPGSFIHPSMPVLYLSQGRSRQSAPIYLRRLLSPDARSFAQDPRFCLSVMAEIACRALSLQ